MRNCTLIIQIVIENYLARKSQFSEKFVIGNPDSHNPDIPYNPEKKIIIPKVHFPGPINFKIEKYIWIIFYYISSFLIS